MEVQWFQMQQGSVVRTLGLKYVLKNALTVPTLNIGELMLKIVHGLVLKRPKRDVGKVGQKVKEIHNYYLIIVLPHARKKILDLVLLIISSYKYNVVLAILVVDITYSSTWTTVLTEINVQLKENIYK